jgi:hypothetical protein
MSFKHHFSFSLSTVLEALKGDISKEESHFQELNHYIKSGLLH